MVALTRTDSISCRPTGIAYAFFDCDAARREIAEGEAYIRTKANTPKGLQMLLTEGTSELKLDEALAELIEYRGDYRAMSSEGINRGYKKERKSLAGMKYVLVATCIGASNEDVANELGDILSIIHREFNIDQHVFRGAVVYKKDGEYQLRE